MSRVFTVEKEVFNFSELSEKSKEKARNSLIEYLYEINSDFFNDYLNDTIDNLFPNSDIKYQYSLSYSQGDGFNLYGTVDSKDMITIIQSFVEDKTEHEKRVLVKYMKDIDVTLHYNNSRYCYSVARNIDFVSEVIDEYNNKEFFTDDEVVTEEESKVLFDFERYFINYIENLNSQFEYQGYNSLYEIDEVTLEEYEYYSNGEVYGLKEGWY